MFEKQHNEKRQTILSFEVDENLFNSIAEIQNKYNLKRSEVARTLLREGLAKYLTEVK